MAQRERFLALPIRAELEPWLFGYAPAEQRQPNVDSGKDAAAPGTPGPVEARDRRYALISAADVLMKLDAQLASYPIAGTDAKSFVSSVLTARFAKANATATNESMQPSTTFLRLAVAILEPLDSPTAIMTMQFGYVLLSQSAFSAIADQYLAAVGQAIQEILPTAALPSNTEQFIEALRRISGSLWPLRFGPIVRDVREGLCLDLAAATMSLKDHLEFPSALTQGPTQARAEHFELAVQGEIDASPWKPTAQLAALRGRTLVDLNGNPFTDLDAVGEKGDVLLLVNAKSILLTAAYETGKYADLRNRVTHVTRYMKEWADRIDTLQRTPGLLKKYNLARFRRVVAPICTPFPVYLPIAVADQWAAPGLRAACTLSELTRWLRENAVVAV